MYTTADEHLDKVRQNLKESAELLININLRKTWGSEEYTEETARKFRQVEQEIRNTLDKLGWPR